MVYTRMTYNTKTIKKWTKALRSGSFTQTSDALNDEKGYCCLGVACKIFIPKNKILKDRKGFIHGAIPDEQYASPKWLNDIDHDFRLMTGVYLSMLNDDGIEDLDPFTFDEISDLVESVFILKVLE